MTEHREQDPLEHSRPARLIRVLGLSIPLDQFSYLIADDESVDVLFEAERRDRPELWQFWRVAAGDEHKVALAYRTGLPRIPQALVIREAVPLRDFKPVDWWFNSSMPAMLCTERGPGHSNLARE